MNTLTLEKILAHIDVPYKIYGNKDAVINNLRLSSQDVEPGDCFFAVRGTKVDGHEFINEAIDKGATVIVCEDGRIESFNSKVSYIVTSDVTEMVGLLADAFYEHPSQKIKVIGVTGTNGKTTVATMIYKMLMGFHRKSGLLSTNGDLLNENEYNLKRLAPTTPDAIFTHRFLRDALNAGCEYVVMEVTSHSTVQNRIKGINFTGAVFTNLSHDHLDYHNTIENYANAKKLFFDNLSPEAFALVNTDDEYGRYMVKDTLAKIYTYGFNNASDFSEIIESKLVGQFNQYNMLAVYAVGTLLGFQSEHIKKILETLDAPRGRFELVVEKDGIRAIVDYAHTPDGVENVLSAAKNIIKGNGRIITLVGCGGDRDPTKRPIMARIAYDLSDIIILTTDNPRTEDPDKILHEMHAGLPEELLKNVEIIKDRREAIQKARSIAEENDIIMVLGKGHETYQEVNGVKTHFDDKEELIQAFQ